LQPSVADFLAGEWEEHQTSLSCTRPVKGRWRRGKRSKQVWDYWRDLYLERAASSDEESLLGLEIRSW
jgi:hypothetical protein